jgi:N-acetylmuramoyl-L-alanine amidase
VKIVDRPSPNFDERAGGAPDAIILHYTDMKTAQEALDRLCDPDFEKRVSSHYLIDIDGTVYRLVPEDKRAWHAGKSYWAGETNMNARSIGIELANPGHTNGYVPFPAAQMSALAELCRGIMIRHNIRPERVLAHSDIAPARKQDPGELFDWEGLAAQGIGVWPDPLKEDFEKAAALDVRAALTTVGYTPDDDLQTVLTAFQRHFHQEIFKTPEKVGQADIETAARLHCLTRQFEV